MLSLNAWSKASSYWVWVGSGEGEEMVCFLLAWGAKIWPWILCRDEAWEEEEECNKKASDDDDDDGEPLNSHVGEEEEEEERNGETVEAETAIMLS